MAKHKPVLIFLVLTFALTWTIQFLTIRMGIGQNSLWGLATMWSPGLIAILCARFVGGGWNDLALKWPKWKYLGFAYIIPAWVALVSVILLFASRTSEFWINPATLERYHGLKIALLIALVYAPTVGMLIPIFSGLGEEIGWRGFLQTHLAGLPPLRKYLLTGMIWSVWHWPLILFTEYASSPHPYVSLVLFTVGTLGMAVLMGYLRDRSGSVWPAAVLHGSHNMWVLGIAPFFYKTTELSPYFAGEAGVFCTLIYAGLAIYIIHLLRKHT
jgi:uncharacterized protein